MLQVVSLAPALVSLTRLELPKLPGAVLQQLATACPGLQCLTAQFLAPPLDLGPVCQLPELRELKLKSSTGAAIEVGESVQQLQRLAPRYCCTHRTGRLTMDALLSTLSRLERLSLLTMTGLTCKDFDVFGLLGRLVELELGDCSAGTQS